MNHTRPDPSSHPMPCALAPAPLPLIGAQVRCGFPSPAEDFPLQVFDVMAHITQHPAATFTMRVSGDSMQDAGILDGCMIVVDRAIAPQHGHIVVAVVDGEFTVKRLFLRHGRSELHAANAAFSPIVLQGMQELQVWGVVTASIVEHLQHARRTK